MCVVHTYSVCAQVRVPVCVCIILFSLCKRRYKVCSLFSDDGNGVKDKALHFQRYYASTGSHNGLDRGREPSFTL